MTEITVWGKNLSSSEVISMDNNFNLKHAQARKETEKETYKWILQVKYGSVRKLQVYGFP